MKKVYSGAQSDEGKTWFPELSDKGQGCVSLKFLGFFLFCFFFVGFFNLQLKFLL